jgi:tetratricopeptide (TPR) repeat protein
MLKALGKAYMEKSMHAEAAERFEQLVKLGSADEEVYVLLSKAYIALGRNDDHALKVYQQAVDFAPEDRDVIFAASTAFLRSGRRDQKALEIYEKAVAYNTPNFKQLGTVLAQLYYQQRSFKHCRATTKQLLARGGYDPLVLSLFLRSCWHLRAYDDAIAELKRLLQVAGHRSQVLRHLVTAYLEKKSALRNNSEGFLLGPTDVSACHQFLQLTSTFRRIRDVILYLDVKRLVLENSAETEQIRRQLEPVMSLGLAEDLTGLEGLRDYLGSSPFNFAQDILTRLETFEALSNQAQLARDRHDLSTLEQVTGSELSEISLSSTQEIELDALEGLLVLTISNFDKLRTEHGSEKARLAAEKFTMLVASQFEKHGLRRAWGTADGLIILAEELDGALRFATQLLRKLERYNFVSDPSEQIHLQVGLHRLGYGEEPTPMRLLNDMAMALKTAVVRWPLATPVSETVDPASLPTGVRILLTQDAQPAIEASDEFRINRLGRFRLQYEPKYVGLYEAVWRDPVEDLRIGVIRRLGKFDLETELGSGPIFRTYRAQDTTLLRPVILKIIQSPTFTRLPFDDPKRQAYQARAKAVARLSHPNLANVYEISEDQALNYLAREFVEGETLGKLLARQGPMDPEQLMTMILAVLRALEYAHDNGVAHGNLRPSNIRVNGANVKLMDFDLRSDLFWVSDSGRAFAAEPKNPRLSYLSPEQLHGLEPAPVSDIFALGTIMYEALTGVNPFLLGNTDSVAQAVLQHRPARPSVLNSQLPEFCDYIVLRSLEKQPARRFPNVSTMIKEIRAAFDKDALHNFNYYIAQARTSR